MTRRPWLDRVLSALKAGDVLVVWKLDRLGRSLSHLIEVVASLKERGIGFRSLTEAIDSATASGQLLFHIIGALAHYAKIAIMRSVAWDSEQTAPQFIGTTRCWTPHP